VSKVNGRALGPTDGHGVNGHAHNRLAAAFRVGEYAVEGGE
jgi:hypothetical protein